MGIEIIFNNTEITVKRDNKRAVIATPGQPIPALSQAEIETRWKRFADNNLDALREGATAVDDTNRSL